MSPGDSECGGVKEHHSACWRWCAHRIPSRPPGSMVSCCWLTVLAWNPEKRPLWRWTSGGHWPVAWGHRSPCREKYRPFVNLHCSEFGKEKGGHRGHETTACVLLVWMPFSFSVLLFHLLCYSKLASNPLVINELGKSNILTSQEPFVWKEGILLWPYPIGWL